jgi:hypothetical protein
MPKSVKLGQAEYYKNLPKICSVSGILQMAGLWPKKYKIFRKKWLTKGRGLSNIAPSNDVPIPQ